MKLLRIFLASSILMVGALSEGGKSENDAGVLIVGGSAAGDGEVPYHLSLIKNDTETGATCGGVLVEIAGHQVGLTSSSCFVNDTSVPWDVMTGYTSFYYLADEQRRRIEKVVKHPDCQDGAVTNDIAVIFFQPFEIDETANNIPLPGTGQTTPQGNMTVSGWGSFNYGAQPSLSLRVLNVTVVDSTVCEQDHGEDLKGVFCARNEDANKFPYIGDEGGPAVSHAGYVAGLFIKADQDIVAIFTDVAYFMTWINSAVKEYYDTSTPTTPVSTTSSSTDLTTTDPWTNPTTADPPTNPTTADPPTNPTTVDPPTNPTTDDPPTNPTTADPPTNPTTADPPTNPTTADPPTNPTTADPPTNPTTADPPTNPTTADPPTNPTTDDPPTNPTTADPPTSPTTSQPPTHPTTLDPSTDWTTFDPSTNSTTSNPSSNPSDSTEDPSKNSAYRQSNLPFELVGLLLSVTVFRAKYMTPC